MKTNLLRGKFSTRPLLLVLCLLVFLPAMALGQITFVQFADNCMTTTTPACTALPSVSNSEDVVFGATNPQTAGNLNVVIVGWSNNNSSIASVTDTAGNTYQIAVGANSTASASGNVTQEIFFAKNIKGGANTITVKFNQNVNFPDVRVLEYRGADATSPMDVGIGASGSGSPANSGPANTNFPNEIMVAGGTTSFAFSGSPNFTNRVTTLGGNIAGDAAAPAAGANANSAVIGNWAMQMATFSPTTTSFPAPTLASPPTSPTSGVDLGGTAVKILGTNFVQGTVVMFGVGDAATHTFSGISAINCTLASSTEIDCITPPHNEGPVDVAVVNPDGQFTFLSAAYQYTLVVPQISTVVPASGPTNGGTQITITGSNFLAPVSVSADGLPATNVSLSGNTVTADMPADITTGAILTVKNADGGSANTIYTYSNPGTGINFIQTSDSGGAPGVAASRSATMLQAENAGDLNVVIVGWSDGNAHTINVSDAEGNTYTQALPPTILVTNPNTGGGIGQVIFYSPNIKGGGPKNTITVSYNPPANFPDVRVAEYSGLDPKSPLDTVASGSGSSGLATSTALSTKFASEIVVAGGTTEQGFSAGTGFNFVPVDFTANGNALMHDVATGSIAVSAPVTPSGAWVVQEVAFHAPGNALPPSFTVSATPTANTNPVSPGSSASYTISVAGQNGFSGAVNLTCSAPANVGITCSLASPSVTPGGGPATDILTVNTTAASAALTMPRQNRMLPLYALWLPLPGIALAGVGLASRRRKLLATFTVLLVIALALFLASCGGGGSSSNPPPPPPPGGNTGTPAGSYSITVTGTSPNATTQTQKVTLTVQ